MDEKRNEAENAHRADELHENVVVHIGEKPVFDIDVYIERRVESHPEQRVFQEVDQPVFPDLEAVGIAEPSIEDDVEQIDDLFGKEDTKRNPADHGTEIENAKKSPVRALYDGKKDSACNKHGTAEE